MRRSPQELLLEALAHLELADRYARDDDLDQMTIDAICMRLSAGIDVLARLDPETRSRLFGEDWPFMVGMRNRIAHGYLLVDSRVVRQTVESDLPGIIVVIRGALADGR